jgi:acetyl-CoA C-acetyltransferase
MPGSIAKRLDLTPANLIYGHVGGQSPQRFVNEMAEAIYNGERELVLVTGAEANGEMKAAQRDGTTHDWSEDIATPFEDRPVDAQFSDYELMHGITFPPQVYALFENAWRKKRGLSVDEHRKVMGQVFAPFSKVAAEHPCAQFPTARDENYLSNYEDGNYQMNIPHGKWHVAQDAVNQGAAFVMTSVGKAQALGIPREQWVFLHGRADADEPFVVERQNFSTSYAMNKTIPTALAMAGRHIDDMQFIDFYSCFPIAVLNACDAAGLSWTDARGLTVTGGLSFFGGAGNNYSSHAIVTMVEKLRESPKAFGIVSANGGYQTKQSVGIYSCQPNSDWQTEAMHIKTSEQQDYHSRSVSEQPQGEGVIETYTVVYAKGMPVVGIVVGLLDNGQRFLANVKPDDAETIAGLSERDPMGLRIAVYQEDNQNRIRFTG